MAQDLPDQLPTWATEPPTAPPTTITEPTELQKKQGWQPPGSTAYPSGKPIRQIMNWWQNKQYQWTTWLANKTFRSSALFSDIALASIGSVPTTGAGFAISDGDFSAGGFIAGYQVPQTDSVAYTYTASHDTYWDLRRDGVWTPASVANGAGAPSVAANSVRVYKVVTDGSGRTSVIDYRSDLINPLTRLKVNASINSVFQINRNDAGTQYSLIAEDPTSTPRIRYYHSLNILKDSGTAGFGIGTLKTINAQWNLSDAKWYQDDPSNYSTAEASYAYGKSSHFKAIGSSPWFNIGWQRVTEFAPSESVLDADRTYAKEFWPETVRTNHITMIEDAPASPDPDVIFKQSMLRAMCVIDLTAGALSIDTSYTNFGVTSLAHQAVQHIRVNLTGGYATSGGGGGKQFIPCVLSVGLGTPCFVAYGPQDVDYFTFSIYDKDRIGVDPAAGTTGGKYFVFVIGGK